MQSRQTTIEDSAIFPSPTFTQLQGPWIEKLSSKLQDQESQSNFSSALPSSELLCRKFQNMFLELKEKHDRSNQTQSSLFPTKKKKSKVAKSKLEESTTLSYDEFQKIILSICNAAGI